MNLNEKQDNPETPSTKQRKCALMKKNTFDNSIVMKSNNELSIKNECYFYLIK